MRSRRRLRRGRAARPGRRAVEGGARPRLRKLPGRGSRGGDSPGGGGAAGRVGVARAGGRGDVVRSAVSACTPSPVPSLGSPRGVLSRRRPASCDRGRGGRGAWGPGRPGRRLTAPSPPPGLKGGGPSGGGGGGANGASFSYTFHGDPHAMFAEFFGGRNPFDTFFGQRNGEEGMDVDDPLFPGFPMGVGGFPTVNFGRPRPAPEPARRKQDPPVTHDLRVSLEEIYSGCTKKMKISHKRLGPDGKSVRNEDKILTIEVKRGWKEGTKITFPKEGDQTSSNIPADIVFVLKDKPHNVFKRDGSDVIYPARISLREVGAGAGEAGQGAGRGLPGTCRGAGRGPGGGPGVSASVVCLTLFLFLGSLRLHRECAHPGRQDHPGRVQRRHPARHAT